jgi:hypothetical protein
MGTVYAIDTSTATSTGDPTNVCSSPFGKGVWFSFRAPASGTLTLNTCGSDFDTVIGIYTGTCDALTFFSCADDNGPACPGAQASCSFPITENTTFYIVVGGYDGASGHLQFTASVLGPTNDQCDAAVALTDGVPYQMNMFGATSSNDPPDCGYAPSPGVWFQYTPTNTGPVTIGTKGSDFTPAIEVFSGSCGNLDQAACGSGPTLHLQATNGITYRIFVSDNNFRYNNGGYPKNAKLQIVVEEGTLPNDTCSGAISLTNGVPYFIDTLRATSTGDPAPACVGYYSADNGTWYTYTPESNGMVTISTCGSDFPCGFQVYTGDCNSLVPLPGGCITGGGPVCLDTASLSFQTAGGIKYYILAIGNLSVAGNLEIQATLSPPSPNDQCQNAIPMQGGILYTQNTVVSTTNGDPSLYNFSNGVWYTFTPASNGVVTISTCGSDFPTAMQVYSGSCNALSTVPEGYSAGSASGCPGNRAEVSFEGIGGVTYHVLVGSYGPVAGNLQIQAALSPSLNDRCANAIAMQDGVVYTRNTTASTSAGDPTPTCSYPFGRGVWYTYTPASNGVVTVSTCGSDFSTALQVYTGTCGALTSFLDSCNNGFGPACSSNQASVVFDGAAGVTYHILVGGNSGATGNLQIQATLSPSLNDHCQNAIPMQDGVVYTRNTTASTSAGDPSPTCGYPFGRGVWYTYTPASNGIVTVNTCGSDFSTALQVYTGSCGALTSPLDSCNYGFGPACPSNQASVVFQGTAGVTYHILVGGNNGATGNLQIQATLSSPLPNDHCDGAIALTNGVAYHENTATATSADDPPYWYDNKGVWFSFTPSADGVVAVGTCGSDYPTTLQIYTGGCNSNSLTPVPDGYNYGGGPLCPGGTASVVFAAKAGTNYLIFVARSGNPQFGNLQIEATLEPAIPNDQCSGAIDITAGGTYLVDTTLATTVGDFENGCGGTVRGVWYRLTALATNLISISIESSNVFPALQIFEGTCGQLTNLLCTYDYYGYPYTSLTFTGAVGRTYFIQAGGAFGNVGNFKITAGAFPPRNDQWFNAIQMQPGLKYKMNNAYASSTNDPVPLCNATAGHGVWYSYTPTDNAQVTVETCDSDFETVLQVYSSDNSTLTPLACNDGFGPVCATNRASVSFFGYAGTNYYFLVAGKNGAFGNLSISANGPPPANDTCDAAIGMTEGVVYTTNTTYASSTGDSFPVTKGVWYRFTPTRAGLLLLNTCGSDFETAFNVYTGACNSLTYYTGGATAFATPCPSNRANAEFPVLPGVTYYIDVGSSQTSLGGNLSIVATMPPPTNDACAGAIALFNGSTYRMNTANATDVGDPTPLCQTNFGKGVWFTYSPPITGTVSISTCKGDLDTVLQVYTGDCGALTPLANSCNDDNGPDCNSFTASIHFQGDAGVTYWILVGGYGGAGGNLGIEANVLPVLKMQKAGTNSVLYWPENLNGFYPEFATNLTPPIFWTNVPYLIGGTYTNGNYFVTSSIPSIPGNSIFYRLRK